MLRRRAVGVFLAFVLGLSLCMAAASPRSIAEMYFALDPDGQNRVTSVPEGTPVWIVVYDADENIDCDVRDKIWTSITVMDPNTGASIVWVSYFDETGDADGDTYDSPEYNPYLGHSPGSSGWLGADYLEETGADTGLFVSKRAFQIGTREDLRNPRLSTHVVDNAIGYLGIDGLPFDFQWGHYEYVDPDFELPATNVWADERGWFGPRQPVADHWPFVVGSMDPLSRPAVLPSVVADAQGGYLLGRFENMDTLVGMYQDQNDFTDVATAMMKIIDTVATITWDQEVYADTEVSAVSATIIVADADENLNCNVVEYVPVFILVNPGSWNPVAAGSPTDFCALLATGGVEPDDTLTAPILNRPIRWYNIYDSGLTAAEWPGDVTNDQEAVDGTYFIQYPVADHANVTWFDTADANGFCRAMFYAQETGVNTGVFQLNMNSILDDLGFNSMRVRDALVAYYLDPNDSDDMRIGVSYITEKQHSITSFTDATRQEKDVYWIGRDPVYVQVIDSNANVTPCSPEQVVACVCDPHDAGDSEWLILAETSSNSPVFFSNAQTKVFPAWDPLGVGLFDGQGGYQLQLDNWKLEAFNEDSVYVRYNDVYYVSGDTGVAGLGDINMTTAFPPAIDRVRVGNDISFDTMQIGDTQVYNGQSVSMYFLDRQGNRVAGYTNADEVFIEVVDPDQNEDPIGRERIDAFWDGAQSTPFGPVALRDFGCTMDNRRFHPVNDLLGDTNIFNSGEGAKIYVLNPRSGLWAPLDLFETGVATGDFVSVTSVDLVSTYSCVPTLGALPGDTIVAFYQDPSNPSDSAMIEIMVYPGGPPPSQMSTTTFTNATGVAVVNYTDADLVYVKVVDPSHSGATTLANAVTIGTVTYSLAPLAGAMNDTFITTRLDLNLTAGTSITATYEDPTDPMDTSSDTISIVPGGCEESCIGLSVAGWHMIALPGELCGACGGASGDLCCALCDDVDPCFIFHYDPRAGGYVMVPPCGAIDASVGMGLWVHVSDATTLCAPVTVPTETVCIPMQAGWNQVGNPFEFDVLLSNTRIRYHGEEVTLEQAEGNGWISMYLFGYDPASGGYVMVMPPSGVLNAVSGYWVRAYVDCEISIPPTPVPPAPPSGVQRADLPALYARGIPTPPPAPMMRAMDVSILDGLVVGNEPNPIRSEHTTTFKVTGPKADLVGAIRVEVYDLSGQLVWREEVQARETQWHTNDLRGDLLANGAYLYQIWVQVGDTWYPMGIRKLAVMR